MSGFDLVPVDGGDPVHLPPGETVLGRGPLLDVSDTRVSRHHGLLENLNGRLRLKPTHVNPCFVLSSPSDDPRPLERGSWFQLRHGDLFSLLPGRFIYRVEATPRNSQNLEGEEEGLPVSQQPDVGAAPDVGQEQKQTPPPPGGPNEDESHSFRQDDSGRRGRRVDDVQSAVRRRVLPAWMMGAPVPKSLASSPKGQSAVRRSQQPAAAADTQATPTSSSLPGEAELSEEEERRPRKKTRKTNNEEEKQETETDVRPAGRSKVSDDSDSISREGDASSQTSDTRETEDREDRKSSEQQVRTPCPYGTDCYRKNPLHFQENSHPGDPDHQEEEERPECPYGTDCYRKNPVHRKQFRHTKTPARLTRTKTIPDENEEEEDGFINDDSEDAGEDSDYVPPNSDSEQEEAAAVWRKRR
ncbi:aprataxin and PNK-like factor isoform X1 [Kryptolebias marmoratus]|uniref:Aprataxin and PNKP like factor n=1 Tax=Kryptolebias marmoratus TaxID=37003 RepID=A0A3Q2ZXB3_KRYMA|nr:aprataxin and PNK-like factor isoform X1 [Kryptolebias marmoratus]